MTEMGSAAAVPAATRPTWSGVSAKGFGSTLKFSLTLQSDMALDLLCDPIWDRHQGEGKGMARQGGGSGSVGAPPATCLVSAGFSSIGRGKALRPTSVSDLNIAGDPPYLFLGSG
jgi:hypothetical protein